MSKRFEGLVNAALNLGISPDHAEFYARAVADRDDLASWRRDASDQIVSLTHEITTLRARLAEAERKHAERESELVDSNISLRQSGDEYRKNWLAARERSEAYIRTMRAQLATARNDALEEAAKAGEAEAKRWHEEWASGRDGGELDVGGAIRALKTPAPVAGDGEADDLR